VAPVAGSTTVLVVDPTTGTISGDSSTATSTTHIETTPDGQVVGRSQDRASAPVANPVAATVSTPAATPTPTPAAAPSAAAPAPVPSATPISAAASDAAGEAPPTLQIPPFFGEDLLKPLPGTKTRGVAFSEWESYRTDVMGRNIIVTTDDSNFFQDRNGKLNGNTGDTDASGLNVVAATDSVIFGSESADQAPWQTDPPEPDDDEGEDEDSDAAGSQATQPTNGTSGEDQDADTDTGDDRLAAASAAFIPLAAAGDDDSFDFPYTTWLDQLSPSYSTAIHTDEGTTLASGQEAFVIGGDGYDDDDNRVTGENIVVTRDDGNVVLGGVGDVNAQIGDSEQGAVIMDVTRTYIKGGGAY
jgi:hypothetical protein